MENVVENKARKAAVLGSPIAHSLSPALHTAAYAAQQEVNSLQGRNSVYFAGAWTGYGFHEDGLKSALRVARLLGADIPWQTQPD